MEIDFSLHVEQKRLAKNSNRVLKSNELYDTIITSYFYFYFSVLIKQFFNVAG